MRRILADHSLATKFDYTTIKVMRYRNISEEGLEKYTHNVANDGGEEDQWLAVVKAVAEARFFSLAAKTFLSW